MPEQTIIIVDDEEELRENLTDLLEFKDYTVHAYSNAEDMLGELDGIHPDLFLLDYQLPGMDGLELLRLVKKRLPSVPVIIVTASTQPAVIEEAQNSGVDKVVHKPYTQADMIAAIDELIS